MTIGIDISPLQGPHRMRGIGYTVLNLINNLPEEARKSYSFVFYQFPLETSSHGDPLELLDTAGLSYEVRTMRYRRRFSRKLPGKLYLINSVLNQLVELRDVYWGDSRISHLKGVDVFLQTDQSQSLPRRARTKKVLILYDVIPYALEWEYLWTYKTARQLHGFSRKAALRCKARRWLYAHKLRVNVRRARLLLAISEQTKKDFTGLLSVPAQKFRVVPLGVTPSDKTTGAAPETFHQYIKTGWGYVKKPVALDPKTPFLLFVGGADKRRRLQDLVTAFNHLRAQGYNIKLVLAGDSMRGPDNIATEEIQYALKTSSYLEDIIFMGFVDDQTRDWLYKNARAFVFPSKYEGFGLPVLEAMAHECPVISYRNSATYEVAGDFPLYVNGVHELVSAAIQLLRASDKDIDTIRRKNLAHVKKYSWHKTAGHIISTLASCV
jgi:glycosyltransferase involved in cell wall biosynthesis